MRSPILDGHGLWTQQAVQHRYLEYCRAFGVRPRKLTSIPDYISERGWITHLIEALIDGMKQGDLAAAEVGIELIEEDGGFAFGRILKSNTARALIRCDLTEAQRERIRKRVVGMMRRGFMPGEFRDYARLLRRIGLECSLQRCAFPLVQAVCWAWSDGRFEGRRRAPSPSYPGHWQW